MPTLGKHSVVQRLGSPKASKRGYIPSGCDVIELVSRLKYFKRIVGDIRDIVHVQHPSDSDLKC